MCAAHPWQPTPAPQALTDAGAQNLRFEPFYDGMRRAVEDPQLRDMFLLNRSSPTHAPLESTTYCVQMVPRREDELSAAMNE